MKLPWQRLLVALLLVPTGVTGSFAQAGLADTSFVSASLKNMTEVYQQTVALEAGLYNGAEYVNDTKSFVKGHPFFKTAAEAAEGIYFDGAWFPNVPLQYDLVLDQVVIEHPIADLKLKLVPEKVTYFTLAGHTFIRLNADSLPAAPKIRLLRFTLQGQIKGAG